MASDVTVLQRDAADPGVDTRILAPRGAGEWLDGHGAITSDPRALDLVMTTIARRAAPADARGAEIAEAARTSHLVDLTVPWALALIGVCLLAGCWVLRRSRFVPPVRAWVDRRVAKLVRQ